MTFMTANELEALRSLDTPKVCDAIEAFRLRLRNEGFTDSSVVSRTARPQPMVGYAVTIQMRTSRQPARGRSYPGREDWWQALRSQPGPKILVIDDTDHYECGGALASGAHGAVFRALDCVGIVTNGTVRDVPALEAMGLHVYSSGIVASHAYAHIIDVGMPVSIAGMPIKTGDLLHGDANGIVNVPHDIARSIPAAAQQVAAHESRLGRFCASDNFSVDRLRRLLQVF